jgi:selenocysteine lyase/cysteine desulfurase
MNTEIRKQFPVLNNYTYLNTASSGIISEDIFQHRREHDDQFLQKASIFRDRYLKNVWRIKKSIESVFSCPAERIGLIPNYSWSVNALAESLDVKNKILTVLNEYPSVVEPFRNRGFKIDLVQGPGDNLDTLCSQIKEKKPQILLVSAVQWTTGNYITEQEFKTIKNLFPELLIVVDGTQSVGTTPMNFEDSGIDALITSGYKWLGAGYGNGFIMMSQQLVDSIQLKIIGNNTIMDRFFTKRNNIGQLWEPGHIDTLNFTTLQKAIEELHKVGLDKIENQIRKLALTLKTGLVQSGYLPASHLGGNKHSGIVLLPGTFEIVRKLKAQDIIVSFRDGIRVSYHYYNTKEDVIRFLDAFRMIVG